MASDEMLQDMSLFYGFKRDAASFPIDPVTLYTSCVDK